MKKLYILFLTAGLLMLLSGGLLVYKNHREASSAGDTSQDVLESMQAMMETTAQPTAPAGETDPTEETEATEPTESQPMKEQKINGQNYIGYLSIPDLGLELPVMSTWSYSGLRVAPCRQQGTVAGHDLVIAAHNYPQHFGKLKDLTPGTYVRFTDMDGNMTEYAAQVVETVGASDEASVLGAKWDLVLYTCTLGGQMRVMLGADVIS